MSLSADDVRSLARVAVPRYTSYPTAPHFSPGFTRSRYAGWLQDLDIGARLSLYVHIPFCDTLCWFCGCTTKITRRYEPVRAYLDCLIREIEAVGTLVPVGTIVTSIHWGGGSPTMLAAEDMERLAEALRRSFRLARDCDFAIEVDPRGLDAARMDALTENGLSRVSIGVQDFDPEVQRAINRIQSFAETKAAADGFRARGVKSLNIDALYGLPHQSGARVRQTLEQVVALKPDRIALFGYAHVPWLKRHQSMIDEPALPDVVTRFDHAEMAAQFLMGQGYRRIGFDHFALPGDAMAEAAADATLRRNFQGYTVDPADALIGLGASAISALPQGYVQNHVTTARYIWSVEESGLATERGIALTEEDRMRRAVIETLLCDMRFSRDGLAQPGHWNETCTAIAEEAEAVLADDCHGLVARTADGFVITEAGRPFMRAIAARFDAYLAANKARHSAAV